MSFLHAPLLSKGRPTKNGAMHANDDWLCLFRPRGPVPDHGASFWQPGRCPNDFGTRHARSGSGTGGAKTGLAFRILEAGYRLAIPRLFAALFLLSLTEIVIYLLLDWLSRRVLRHWHESATRAEEE
jgi:hypothetical protein